VRYDATARMDPRDEALVRLGVLLKESGYRFTTITPASHHRVNARPENAVARSLRDVFGWSRPFPHALLPPAMLAALETAGCIVDEGALLRSSVRFSSDAGALFVHSAFPTSGSDAVFFGPDTYRFLALLERLQPRARRAVDIGCGSGAGGLRIANACDDILLADINDVALRYARVNAALNGVMNASAVYSDVLAGIDGEIDLIISNPPYLIDRDARVYRDGGGRFGEGLSVEIVRQSLARLRSGGRLILYSATAFVDGVDTFHTAIEPLLAAHDIDVRYEELDPDVFGAELGSGVYVTADRIAVIALDLRVR
jgi:precorrin-6B methylase 2